MAKLLKTRLAIGTMETRDRTMELSKEGEKTHAKKKMSPFGHLFRFVGWWFGFTGLYAVFSVCPICGQQGCPVGLASAGTIGALFSLGVQDWKLL
jgi:hypothetical protein